MQGAPDRDIAPPVRPMISARLRALKRGESWFFEGPSPASIQALITRVKKEYDGAREFTSEWQGKGLRVWRLK